VSHGTAGVGYNSTAGTAGTGGGGGGGSCLTGGGDLRTGSAGGSGVVVVRYTRAQVGG
jgi:hypothetical protein